MTQGSHPKRAPPTRDLVILVQIGEDSPVNTTVLRVRHDIEDPCRELHDPERVFESFVRSAGIDQIRQSQLVDVSESLNETPIQYSAFALIESDENVDWIADLERIFLRHAEKGRLNRGAVRGLYRGVKDPSRGRRRSPTSTGTCYLLVGSSLAR